MRIYYMRSTRFQTPCLRRLAATDLGSRCGGVTGVSAVVVICIMFQGRRYKISAESHRWKWTSAVCLWGPFSFKAGRRRIRTDLSSTPFSTCFHIVPSHSVGVWYGGSCSWRILPCFKLACQGRLDGALRRLLFLRPCICTPVTSQQKRTCWEVNRVFTIIYIFSQPYGVREFAMYCAVAHPFFVVVRLSRWKAVYFSIYLSSERFPFSKNHTHPGICGFRTP